jgi:thiol peroxidase
MCLHVQCEKEHGNKPGHEPPTHKIHDVFAKSKPSLDCHLSQIMVIPIQKNPAPEVDKIKTMEEYMATVTLNGKETHTVGDLPAKGSKGADFKLTRADLSDVSLAAYAGKKKILNIVISLDTGVCAESARRFNEAIAKYPDTVVLTISNDLPFAQERFCKNDGIDNVVTLSQMRDKSFGRNYGVEIVDGPLAGILTRAIVVLDENNVVIHTELVPETSHEPDYDAALKSLS